MTDNDKNSINIIDSHLCVPNACYFYSRDDEFHALFEKFSPINYSPR